MAAGKEAIGIVLDVGPSMNQAPPGVATPLETAIEGINMILQRKMFSESKDEVALILFGTNETENPLDDDDTYQNIVLKRPLGVADFDLLQTVQTELQPGDAAGDFLDALVVALHHLKIGLEGKKGFGSKRLILFSDLGGPYGDQGVDTIIAAMQNMGTELNVIGPNMGDDNSAQNGGDEDGARGGGSNGDDRGRKEKTPQQRSGEAMIKHILDQVSGECYSFSEALPALSYFQSRQVKPMAWKCVLEIGDLQIPINGYSKVKEFKLKQSWKKVYAQDPSTAPGTLRTYHMNNAEETEVEKEDMVEGYRYGNTLVPMSDIDKESMKYKAEKCLKVLGFTKTENFKRHLVLGDGALSITAEKGDEAAAVALSALINALYETNSVAIARRVYAGNSAPRLGCLVPHIKANYECLFWLELPFAEDVRAFTFGSLPLTEDSPANKKYKPSEDQLKCMDDLITCMDLTQALEDEDGDKEEALKPKLTFNPYFQRVYQCLQHRVLNPDEQLPDLSPLIASYLSPPPSIKSDSSPCLDRLQKLFRLEVVDKDKEQLTGENMFKEKEEEAGPSAKKPKMDGDLEGGIQKMTRAQVTQVGSVTPIEDFYYLISRKDCDLFDEACQQLQKRVEQIVFDSFGQQFYGKAMDCLKALRKECVKKSEPMNYNKFIEGFYDILRTKARRDFWDLIVKGNQGLISKLECEDSTFSVEEVDKFMSGAVKVEAESRPQEEETADDLLMEL